jgi:phage protein D/phage baseplate assembly protein gpV
MSGEAVIIYTIRIKVDGTFLNDTIMDKLEGIDVEMSLGMPDMFTIRFHDDTKFTLIDGTTLDIGKEIEIEVGDSYNNSLQIIMKGEITALEPIYKDDLTVSLVVRGYDKTHRLSRMTPTRSFTNVTDSDIVSTIASDYGLASDITTTSFVHPSVIQAGMSDQQFLELIAERNGFAMLLHDSKITMKSLANMAPSSVATLRWGLEMLEFHPKISLVQQASKVIVRGWNVSTKQAIVGEASTVANKSAEIGFGNPITKTNGLFGSNRELRVFRHAVEDQTQATRLATAILESLSNQAITAEGIALGNSALKAGKKITIDKCGTKFNGTYILSSVLHSFTHEGYVTHFKVEGTIANTISDLIDDGIQPEQWNGVYPAIVTNIKDSQGEAVFSSVKVKFPWTAYNGTELESQWARLSIPGAGNQRGIMWMPEVNDEVLVAFESGNINRPYIIGGLYNGQDTSPLSATDAIPSSSVVKRGMKTRIGQQFVFTEDSSDKKIEILSSGGTLNIIIDETGKKISIEASDAGATIDIKAQGAISITSDTADVNLKATANVKMEATGNIDVNATGILTLKGSLVKIN